METTTITHLAKILDQYPKAKQHLIDEANALGYRQTSRSKYAIYLLGGIHMAQVIKQLGE